MLTRGMVHLAFPSVAEKHYWIEEGIATYIKPIARIQAGHLKAEQMWLVLVRDMPQGPPQVGDRGLDHTHSWGRTYWGGALFCLVADIEIRRQTNNAKGLEHALRGILDAGGDNDSATLAAIRRAIETGESAAREHSLSSKPVLRQNVATTCKPSSCTDKRQIKRGLPGLPIKGPVKIAK